MFSLVRGVPTGAVRSNLRLLLITYLFLVFFFYHRYERFFIRIGDGTIAQYQFILNIINYRNVNHVSELDYIYATDKKASRR